MGKLQEILVAGQVLLNLPGSQQQAGTGGLAGLEEVRHKSHSPRQGLHKSQRYQGLNVTCSLRIQVPPA